MFSVIVLVAFILEFVLELVANLLNLKALSVDLPPALEGIYKEEDYGKSQEYVRITTRFGLFRSAFTLLLLLAPAGGLVPEEFLGL